MDNMEISATTVWLVQFIILSLVSGVFIWLGVRIFSRVSLGDYLTAAFVGAAAMLAINFAQQFFTGSVSALVSLLIGVLILTIFIHMAYDIGFSKALGAAVVAMLAIFVTIFIVNKLGIFETGLVTEIARNFSF